MAEASVCRAHWRWYPEFVFENIAARLSRQLRQADRPTLIGFGGIYAKIGLTADHVAVAVGVTPQRILLLDPLGRPPSRNVPWNVSIERETCTDQTLVARGSFYDVAKQEPVGLLIWRRGAEQTH